MGGERLRDILWPMRRSQIANMVMVCIGSRVCMALQHGALPMPHDLETHVAVFANLNPDERTPFPVGWTSLQQDMREDPDSICLAIPMHASIAYAMTFW